MHASVLCLQVYCFGRLKEFQTAVKCKMPKTECMRTYGLTTLEYDALADPACTVQLLRRSLIVEHNDIPEKHRSVTIEERLKFARRDVQRSRAEEKSEEPWPTDVKDLTEAERDLVSASLSMKRSAFFDRARLALLPDRQFNKLMRVFGDIRTFHMKHNKRGEPKFNVRAMELMLSSAGPEAFDKFLDRVLNGSSKLSECKAFGEDYLRHTRKPSFALFPVFSFLFISDWDQFHWIWTGDMQ